MGTAGWSFCRERSESINQYQVIRDRQQREVNALPMRQHLPLRARGQADAGRGCEPSWKSPVQLHRGFQQPQVGGVVQIVCVLRGIHEIRRFPTVGKVPRTRAGRITEWAIHGHVNQSVKYLFVSFLYSIHKSEKEVFHAKLRQELSFL